MTWYWRSQPGGRGPFWYGVSVSRGRFRLSLIWITRPTEVVTMDELYERLKAS